MLRSVRVTPCLRCFVIESAHRSVRQQLNSAYERNSPALRNSARVVQTLKRDSLQAIRSPIALSKRLSAAAFQAWLSDIGLISAFQSLSTCSPNEQWAITFRSAASSPSCLRAFSKSQKILTCFLALISQYLKLAVAEHCQFRIHLKIISEVSSSNPVRRSK